MDGYRVGKGEISLGVKLFKFVWPRKSLTNILHIDTTLNNIYDVATIMIYYVYSCVAVYRN